MMIWNTKKFEITVITIEKYKDTTHNICNLRHKTPEETYGVLHDGSNYDYHFIIKEWPEGYEGQIELLGENEERHPIFLIAVQRKKLESDKKITYKKNWQRKAHAKIISKSCW